MAVLTVLFALSAPAQQVQVSSANKTIAVTADDKVSVDPDIAVVNIGYTNYAPTHADAYRTNVRKADEIIKALISAGVKPELIQSDSVAVERVDPEENWTVQQKNSRIYLARQAWSIRVPAKLAQGVVDVAMNAGCNHLRGVDWDVADRVQLQGKAGAAALAKARKIAEQMAHGLGAKLGDLVYASNRAPAVTYMPTFMAQANSLQTSVGVVGREPSITLFPEKVEESATVHAVFAIQ